MLRVFGQAVAFLDRLRFGLEEHAEIYRDYDSLNNATQLHINNESAGHGDRARITLAIDVVNGGNFINLRAREAGPETSLVIHSDGYVDVGSGELRTQNFKLNGWLETALNGETVGSLFGTVNNLDPPNDSRRVRLNTTGAATVTGLTGASAGRLRDLIHVGAHQITLAHASGSSSAANRFTCPGGVDYVVPPGATVRLWQDPAISGWRVLADAQSWRVPEGTKLIFSATPDDAYIEGFGSKGGTLLIFGSGSNSMSFQAGTLDTPTVTANAGGFQTLTARGAILELSFLSPANLTASQNNWAPGATGVRNIRLSANAGLSITGLSAGQTTGRLIRLFNIGSNAITITHESGSSSAANRFLCPGSSNFSLAANAAVDLWYDGASSRWRLVR